MLKQFIQIKATLFKENTDITVRISNNNIYGELVSKEADEQVNSTG